MVLDSEKRKGFNTEFNKEKHTTILKKVQFWSVVFVVIGFPSMLAFNTFYAYPQALDKYLWSTKEYSKDKDEFGGLLSYPQPTDSAEEANKKRNLREKAITFIDDRYGNKLEVFRLFHENYPDQEKNKNYPLVIYLPGSSGVEGATAKTMFDAGFDVVTYNYPGFGNSSGNPDYQNFIHSSETILDYVRKKYNVEPADIAIFSASLGTVAAFHLAQTYTFGSIVLVNPVDSAFNRCMDNLNKTYVVTCLTPQFLTEFNNIQAAKTVKPNTFYQVSSNRDQIFPLKNQYEVFTNINNNSEKNLFTVNGGHNGSDSKQSEEITRFIAKNYELKKQRESKKI